MAAFARAPDNISPHHEHTLAGAPRRQGSSSTTSGETRPRRAQAWPGRAHSEQPRSVPGAHPHRPPRVPRSRCTPSRAGTRPFVGAQDRVRYRRTTRAPTSTDPPPNRHSANRRDPGAAIPKCTRDDASLSLERRATSSKAAVRSHYPDSACSARKPRKRPAIGSSRRHFVAGVLVEIVSDTMSAAAPVTGSATTVRRSGSAAAAAANGGVQSAVPRRPTGPPRAPDGEKTNGVPKQRTVLGRSAPPPRPCRAGTSHHISQRQDTHRLPFPHRRQLPGTPARRDPAHYRPHARRAVALQKRQADPGPGRNSRPRARNRAAQRFERQNIPRQPGLGLKRGDLIPTLGSQPGRESAQSEDATSIPGSNDRRPSRNKGGAVYQTAGGSSTGIACARPYRGFQGSSLFSAKEHRRHILRPGRDISTCRSRPDCANSQHSTTRRMRIPNDPDSDRTEEIIESDVRPRRRRRAEKMRDSKASPLGRRTPQGSGARLYQVFRIYFFSTSALLGILDRTTDDERHFRSPLRFSFHF